MSVNFNRLICNGSPRTLVGIIALFKVYLEYVLTVFWKELIEGEFKGQI